MTSLTSKKDPLYVFTVGKVILEINMENRLKVMVFLIINNEI